MLTLGEQLDDARLCLRRAQQARFVALGLVVLAAVASELAPQLLERGLRDVPIWALYLFCLGWAGVSEIRAEIIRSDIRRLGLAAEVG